MATGRISQRFVNSLDQGAGARFLKGLIWFVLAVGIMWGYSHAQFRGLRSPAAMDAAQLGRRLAQGKGYTTACIRPADVAFLKDHRRDIPHYSEFPEIRRAPGYPVLLSLGLRLFKPESEGLKGSRFAPEKNVVVPLGILLSALSALLLRSLARRLFDPTIAMTATLVYLLTDAVLGLSISGSSVVPATCAFLAMTWALLTYQDRTDDAEGLAQRWWPFLAAALFAAAAVLTRYSMLLPVGVMLVYLGTGGLRKRWATAGLLLLVIVLLISPWLVRNIQVSGAPFGAAPVTALNESRAFPSLSYDQSIAPKLSGTTLVPAMRSKLLSNFVEFYNIDLRTLGSGFIICFFIVSLFCKLDDRRVDVLNRYTAATVVAALLVSAVSRGGAPSLMPLCLPLVSLFGTAFIYRIVMKQEFFHLEQYDLVVWSAVALSLLPTVVKVIFLSPARPYPPYYPPFAQFVSDQVPAGTLLATDIPWSTAWHAGQPSLLLPTSPEDILAVPAELGEVGAIYLSTETTSRPNIRMGTERSEQVQWATLVRQQAPDIDGFGFTNAIAFPSGTTDHLLLLDRLPADRSNQ